MRAGILVAAVSCAKLCASIMSYDLACPGLATKDSWVCGDLVDRHDPPAMIWTARWNPWRKEPEPESDSPIYSQPGFLRDL